MNKTSKLSLTICAVLLSSLSGMAQDTEQSRVGTAPAKVDSLSIQRENMKMQAALRYPTLRMAMLQTESGGSVHYTSKLHGNDFVEGNIRPKNIVSGFFNLPVYSSRKQEISVALRYYRLETVLGNTTNKIPQSPVSDGSYTLQTLALALNYKRTDSLFGRPIIWGGSLIAHSSLQSGINKISGLAYGIFPLKTTRMTRIAAGLVVIADPTSNIPVLPTFSYWHKFGRSPWEVSIDIPTGALLRRNVFSKGLLSLGTELSSNTLFRNIDQPLLPGKAQFRELNLKSGVTLEYPIARKMLIGCSGGILSTMQYRVLEPYRSLKDYDVAIKRNPGPYLNISISFLR